MSDMTVLAWFTKSTGDLPGTGLTLADIDLTLTAIHRTTGAETAIWNTENPAFEVANVGAYGKIYDADFDTYNYAGGAQYADSETLDNDYVSGSLGIGITFAGEEGGTGDMWKAITVTHKNNPSGAELVTVQEDIYCTPIDRLLGQQWLQDYPTNKQFLMRQTYTKYTAFQAGDYLVYDSVTFAIKAVHAYDAQGSFDAFYFLILEWQSGS